MCGINVNDEPQELSGVTCDEGFTCGKKFREFPVGDDKYELFACTPNRVGALFFVHQLYVIWSFSSHKIQQSNSSNAKLPLVTSRPLANHIGTS